MRILLSAFSTYCQVKTSLILAFLLLLGFLILLISSDHLVCSHPLLLLFVPFHDLARLSIVSLFQYVLPSSILTYISSSSIAMLVCVFVTWCWVSVFSGSLRYLKSMKNIFVERSSFCFIGEDWSSDARSRDNWQKQMFIREDLRAVY